MNIASPVGCLGYLRVHPRNPLREFPEKRENFIASLWFHKCNNRVNHHWLNDISLQLENEFMGVSQPLKPNMEQCAISQPTWCAITITRSPTPCGLMTYHIKSESRQTCAHLRFIILQIWIIQFLKLNVLKTTDTSAECQTVAPSS